MQTTRLYDTAKPAILPEDAKPAYEAHATGRLRLYFVTRWVHAGPVGKSDPFLFTEVLFTILAQTGPDACRIADAMKVGREQELGWVKPDRAK